MTISKTIYDPNKDTRPPKVSIGVSLITKECDRLVQDGRYIEIPVDDEIVYITIPREIIYLSCGNASYETIAELLEQEGYLEKYWSIVSVWECVPEHISNEIF